MGRLPGRPSFLTKAYTNNMRYVALGFLLSSSLLAQDSEIKLVSVTSGLSTVTDIQNARDGSGRLFIIQQDGTVRILRGGALVPQLFLDIHTRTRAEGERGLLGMAFPPDFSTKQ